MASVRYTLMDGEIVAEKRDGALRHHRGSSRTPRRANCSYSKRPCQSQLRVEGRGLRGAVPGGIPGPPILFDLQIPQIPQIWLEAAKLAASLTPAQELADPEGGF